MSSALTIGGLSIAYGIYATEEQKIAARKARKSQEEASGNAIESQERMYNQARQDYMPYANIGRRAATPASASQYNAMTGNRTGGVTGGRLYPGGSSSFNETGGGNSSLVDQAANRRVQEGVGALSPYERQVYQGNQASNNALAAYNSYQGQALPGATIAAPQLPGGNVNVMLPHQNLSMEQNKYLVGTEQAKVNPNNYDNIDPNAYYVDPSQHGVDTLDFKMSENDPVYKWKQEQARKNVMKNLAASGLSGSKYGATMSADASMGVAVDEYESQYNRALNKHSMDYQQDADLYNRTAEQQNALYGRTYAKESDLYNRTAEQQAMDWNRKFTQQDALYGREYGLKSDNYDRGFQNSAMQYQMAADNYSRNYQNAMTGYNVASDNYNRNFQNASYLDNRDQNKLANSFNMTNALDNQTYNKSLDAIKIGAGAAGQTGTWAMNNGSNIAQMQQNQGNNQANMAIAQGNINANMISGIGSTATNALAAYYASR